MGWVILRVGALYGYNHTTGPVNLWVTFQWEILDLLAHSILTPHGGYIALNALLMAINAPLWTLAHGLSYYHL